MIEFHLIITIQSLVLSVRERCKFGRQQTTYRARNKDGLLAGLKPEKIAEDQSSGGPMDHLFFIIHVYY